MDKLFLNCIFVWSLFFVNNNLAAPSSSGKTSSFYMSSSSSDSNGRSFRSSYTSSSDSNSMSSYRSRSDTANSFQLCLTSSGTGFSNVDREELAKAVQTEHKRGSFKKHGAAEIVHLIQSDADDQKKGTLSFAALGTVLQLIEEARASGDLKGDSAKVLLKLIVDRLVDDGAGFSMQIRASGAGDELAKWIQRQRRRRPGSDIDEVVRVIETARSGGEMRSEDVAGVVEVVNEHRNSGKLKHEEAGELIEILHQESRLGRTFGLKNPKALKAIEAIQGEIQDETVVQKIARLVQAQEKKGDLDGRAANELIRVILGQGGLDDDTAKKVILIVQNQVRGDLAHVRSNEAKRLIAAIQAEEVQEGMASEDASEIIKAIRDQDMAHNKSNAAKVAGIILVIQAKRNTGKLTEDQRSSLIATVRLIFNVPEPPLNIGDVKSSEGRALIEVIEQQQKDHLTPENMNELIRIIVKHENGGKWSSEGSKEVIRFILILQSHHQLPHDVAAAMVERVEARAKSVHVKSSGDGSGSFYFSISGSNVEEMIEAINEQVAKGTINQTAADRLIASLRAKSKKAGGLNAASASTIIKEVTTQ